MIILFRNRDDETAMCSLAYLAICVNLTDTDEDFMSKRVCRIVLFLYA